MNLRGGFVPVSAMPPRISSARRAGKITEVRGTVGQWARLHVEIGRRDVNFGFADHDHPSAATARWTNRTNVLPSDFFFFLARLLSFDFVPSCLAAFRAIFSSVQRSNRSARILPPFEPPSLPNATALGFFGSGRKRLIAPANLLGLVCRIPRVAHPSHIRTTTYR